jgi:hypothetical protein
MMIQSIRIKECLMRKLIRLPKGQPHQNIIRLGQPLDPSPKFNLIQLRMRLQYIRISQFQPQPI